MLPFSSTTCHSHPFGFPVVFPAGFLGSTALPEESYQSGYNFTVQSSTVRIQLLRWVMTAPLFDTAPKIFYQANSFMLAYTSKNSETDKATQTESLIPLSFIQTHSSTISSQRDCTHSNKQRRRLLSECNYLVLSISLTAGGQRALC